LSLSDLYWREPLWLLLIFLPLLMMAMNSLWQRRQLLLFADASLIPWVKVSGTNRSNYLPVMSLLLGWVFLCIATAGPRSIKHLPAEYQVEPSTLIVIVDLSESMNARDSRPDRRSTAQQLLDKWILQKPPTLAVGMVLFAGHAFELLPATTDLSVLSHFVKSLSDIRLPTAGNDFPAALKLAEASLSVRQNHRRILVLTDGDIELSEREKVMQIFTQEWNKLNIKTSIIGLGESNPVTVPNTVNGLVKFQDRPVLSQLEDDWLKKLSTSSNINYRHYHQANRLNLDTIIELPALRISPDIQQQVIWFEWFSLPLLIAVLLLLMSMFFNQRKLSNVRSKSNVLPLFMLFLLLPVFAVLEPVAYAGDREIIEQAQQALDNKQYRQAQQLFRQLSSFESYFGEGTACYRQKDFKCAQQAFSSAAWVTSDQLNRAKAVFNLANSYFFSAEYDQAITLYRDAGLLGLDNDLIAINLSYAETMQAAIQRHLKHIQQSYKRALWKAATTGERNPTLAEFVADYDSSSLLTADLSSQQSEYRVSTQTVQSEVIRLLGLNRQSGKISSGRWIETERVLPQSTAKMLNHLFEMELGILTPLKQPQVIKGKRKW